MKEERTWSVLEKTTNGNRLIKDSLSKREAYELASRYNRVGDYTYAAVPLVVRIDHDSLDAFNILY